MSSSRLHVVVASIPSPSDGTLDLGPVSLHMYGLMIALGVFAAVWLASRRFEELGVGTRDDVSAIALWAVPAGVIGARLYHVVTDWELFRDDPVRMFKIWQGGLGIPGGIALGVAVGVWRARVRGLHVGWALTAVTPALPLAQAIGRLGNWWNQELFGGPTSKPWGLEISPDKRPPGYEQFETFHPAFLYEMIWNLALCVALIWIGRRFRLRAGHLFAVYVAGYGIGRLYVESIRIDYANEILGLRVNQWTAIAMIVGGSAFVLIGDVLRRPTLEESTPPAQRQPAPEPTEAPAAADGAGGAP